MKAVKRKGKASAYSGKLSVDPGDVVALSKDVTTKIASSWRP